MVDLKRDLDEYLLLQSDQKKSFNNFKFTLPTLQRPTLPNWTGRGQAEEESWFRESSSGCCPSLSRFQRITCFCICVFMGILCFSLSAIYIPVLLFKARKFALLYTLGSLFFILSFSFLWGPAAYFKSMFSRERILNTLMYGSTLFATLYFALHLQSTPLTVLGAVGQVISLFWTLFASIPGGAAGISFFTKIFSRTVTSSLPI